ncbi:MAG: haloacid dehalogenase-like hydrolase [Actinomycetota bacterium]|nr:haloacid dehalogenase-like hydrolase [Actinomycetota bacterium]
MSRLLLLFDIDGTLLQRASDAHAAAVHEAIRTVWDVPDPGAARVEAAGRTDLEIVRAILLNLGVDAARIDAGMNDFRVAAGEAYARMVPADLSELVVPGMEAVLDELAHRDDVVLSLVTGNLEAIARLKLRAAGIGHRFAPGQGGFGSDDEDRSRLPGVARWRAGDGAGRAFARERTVVIGDTPRDIACARADGVRCVAVTTGPFAARELGDADAVVASPGELPGAVARVVADGAGPPRPS